MGWNTTVFIRNDGLDQIQANPDEFVRGIVRQMHDGGTVSVGNHANPVEVMRSEHADYYRLYATWMNTIVELGPGVEKTKEFYANFPDTVRDIISMARSNLDRLEAQLILEHG